MSSKKIMFIKSLIKVGNVMKYQDEKRYKRKKKVKYVFLDCYRGQSRTVNTVVESGM